MTLPDFSQMSPSDLTRYAQRLPLRRILCEKGLYLSRYMLRETRESGHAYLHHFHRSDDAELHNHPWPGRSHILAGGYVEERLTDPVSLTIEQREFLPGSRNTLASSTFHRVELLDPAAGCWTLFTTGPATQSWSFLDRATGRRTPWRTVLRAKGLL